jgi:hypothetical protein
MGSTSKQIEWQGIDDGKYFDSLIANRMIGDFVRPSPPKNL